MPGTAVAWIAMIENGWRSSDAGDPELIEGAFGGGPRVIPEAVAPVSRLRSPILEHRRVDPLTIDDDRAAISLPALRTLLGPSGLALLVAAPVMLIAGWQAAVVVGFGAAAYRELDRRIGRVGFSLGDGFLPYRPQTGWPQGVQEDNDVRWNWSPMGDRPAARGGQPVRG
jgi:hypothetical protein